MEACLKDTISQEKSNKELSYVSTEDMEIEEFPILPKIISKNQKKNLGLKKLIKAEKEKIMTNMIEEHKIVLYNNHVYIPP